MDIRIGPVGHITAGEQCGLFVRIEAVGSEPPSYLVLLAHDQDFLRGYGDDWVEDRASLEQYFREGRWTVDWTVGRDETAEAHRRRLVRLVERIVSAEESEAEVDRLVREFSDSVPHPRVLDLLFHSDPPLTAGEVVTAALAYRPIAL